jgi:hypothetical protein
MSPLQICFTRNAAFAVLFQSGAPAAKGITMDSSNNRLENFESLDSLLKMDNFRVQRLLSLHVSHLRGSDGAWNFHYRDVEMMLFTDETNDRIRIISPINSIDDQEPKYLHRLLQANFLTAIDVRYAIYQDTLWAVFVRSLSTLTRSEFEDALNQVAALAKSTGSDFSSLDPQFL